MKDRFSLPPRAKSVAWPARILLLPLLLSAVCGVFVPDARAMIQFDVFVGHDGVMSEGSWLPVVCEVKNDGPPFVGVIDLTPANYGQGLVRRAVVELPTGSLKRIVIPVFAASRYSSGWDARLLDERGKVHAEQLNLPLQPRRNLSWKTPALGALARNAGGAPSFRQILAKQSELQPACARLQPAIFPDNPLVLEGLSAIYLNSERALELKEGQVRALLAWLHAGGHLIVGVEQISDVNALPWLRSILPCELTDVHNVTSHGELQSWLRLAPEGTTNAQPLKPSTSPRRTRSNRPTKVETAEIAEAAAYVTTPDDAEFEAATLSVATGVLRGGRVVAGTPEAPLIVSGDMDRGRVTALLFSPEREPFRSWKNQPLFWAKMLEVPAALYSSSDYNQMYEPGSDGIFGAMIDSRQVRKMPVGWLLLLLTVYLVVIGPLDRIWLKKLGKPMLTWITFPCYVVLFSLLIYFIGYKLRAGESEWNELHLVDVLPNGERAELRGHTYGSLYSPANQRYKLANQARVATLRSEFVGSWASQRKEDDTVLQQGDTFSAEIFVPVWVNQLYVSDWWQPAPLPVSLSVADQGRQWSVTVNNHQERPLNPARLVIAGRIFDLGEVPAKQSKTFAVSKDQGSQLPDFVWQKGSVFQQAAMSRQRAFGGDQSGWINNAPDAAMAASFLAAMANQQGNTRFVEPPGLDLSSLVARGQAVLLAWETGYSPIPPLNQFAPRRSHRDTLWRVASIVQK